jgi:hypothetical protein
VFVPFHPLYLIILIVSSTKCASESVTIFKIKGGIGRHNDCYLGGGGGSDSNLGSVVLKLFQ